VRIDGSDAGGLGINVVRRNGGGHQSKMVVHLMADHTKGDQVIRDIAAELTPLRQMMYMQVFQ
jgi:hypothetical protein